MRRRISYVILAVALGLWIGILLSLILPVKALAVCHPIPVTAYSPTGVAGCTSYGLGTASWWQGPGVARNDCVWPWTHCEPIIVTSLDTGRSLTVRPTMFCDCFTGTSSQRIVDLDPAALSALGLDPSQGLYSVSVQPATTMPDTAME